MEKFHSLEEFLALPDGDRCSIMSKTGQEWLKYYAAAKKSWETYGDNPPSGSIVETLRAGFGGRDSVRRILAGVFERDERFFFLSYGDGDRGGLSRRDTWWLDFKVIKCPQEISISLNHRE